MESKPADVLFDDLRQELACQTSDLNFGSAEHADRLQSNVLCPESAAKNIFSSEFAAVSFGFSSCLPEQTHFWTVIVQKCSQDGQNVSFSLTVAA